jgi:hypothetical protein
MRKLGLKGVLEFNLYSLIFMSRHDPNLTCEHKLPPIAKTTKNFPINQASQFTTETQYFVEIILSSKIIGVQRMTR